MPRSWHCRGVGGLCHLMDFLLRGLRRSHRKIGAPRFAHKKTDARTLASVFG